MAIVNLKDVTVTRLNKNGNGVKVTEESTSRGVTYSQRYTLWFEEPSGLTEGEVVSVSGFLGMKVDEWTDKDNNVRHSVEASVNKPRIVVADAAPVGVSSGDQWNTPAVSDEVPF